jgi:hypothetical protein
MRFGPITLLAMLVGCGGSDLRTLTRDDVSGLPTGDATGALISGQYVLTVHRAEACRCRVGRCTGFMFSEGQPVLFVQADGFLSMTDPLMSATGQGGVDTDGHFWVGALKEQPGDTQYTLIDGAFVLSGGAPVSMSGTQEMTITTQPVSSPLDCDLKIRIAASFVGPLTTALAAISMPDPEGATWSHSRPGVVGPIHVFERRQP